LYIEVNQTQWAAATTGTPDALNASAEARAGWMRFWADPEPYRQYKAWDEEHTAGEDARLAREVHLLHLGFAEGQRDPATIGEVAELEKALSDAYTNFRSEVDGQRLTVNAIDQVLAEEKDSEKRRAAWEASKQIGPVVADNIRRLAELRNDAAHRMGYANFHRMSLTLNELDPDWLYGMLDELAVKTDGPFRQVKAQMDAELSQRYRVPVEELMPWHYAEPFFQRAPMLGALNFDALYDGKDLVDLARQFYGGIGMDVDAILSRSDLYERDGKDQHAFCTHIDREGDVRILCNLQPTLRWMDTLLHELGHGVYDQYIPEDLPWLLRSFPHILSTESMAMLMGAMTLEPEWHRELLGASPDEAAQRGQMGADRFRLEELIFARWVMVVVNFERLMYEDPARDLNALWWELVEKYQFLRRPEGRESLPDWATKYHIALAPAYYQNYLLGRMMSLQWANWLEQHAGGIVGKAEAGAFFRERIFAPGNVRPWNEALEAATGEPLNVDYFVKKFAR
jgi:peptidyl-dipeptidase A